MWKMLSGKWPFYISGLLMALLVNLGLYLFNAPVGMSDGYLTLSMYCNRMIEKHHLTEPPALDWQTGFLVGIFGGALLTVLFSKQWKFEMFPDDLKGSNSFASAWKCLLHGLFGGFLVMLGLQLAGDSFFGQWAAAMQLSPGAWIFILAFFITGSLAAIVMSKREEGGGKSAKAKSGKGE